MKKCPSLWLSFFLQFRRDKYVDSVEYIISFIFIPWIRTGLQNPYGYGNSQICLGNYYYYLFLFTKSIQGKIPMGY
jgi:hypothetical protein